MKIHAHIITFNESETIHLTIKHYRKFCEKIFIYDNFSTDNTRDICESMGCEVKMFGVSGVLDDKEYLKVKNHCWKGSDADWVIICDADEILQMRWIHNLSEWDIDQQRFKKSTFSLNQKIYTDSGANIIKTQGFNIFSNEMPKESWSEITTGIPDNNYSKLCIFKPKEIKEIGYVYGAHVAKPEGDVRYSDEILTLFHYKHVGGAQRIADRHALYNSRLSDWNKRFKCGYQYQEPREQTIKYFNECLKKSVPYSQAGF